MAGTLTPTPYQTVLDADGVAVSGALIYTYVGGTTTAATTYADASLATPNPNPIVADSAGRFVAYLPAGGNFKFTYKTAAGATIEEQDNILSVPGAAVNLDIEGTVGQAVTAGQVCYLSTGAEATPLTAGLWYLTDADFAPTSTTCQSVGVAVSAIAINTAGTIRLAGTATTASAVVIGSTYYVSATAGAITATPPALSRTVGVALTTSTLLLAATTAVVTPAGSNTQVQFNDSGVLGGDSGFTFIKATDAVAIGGPLAVTGATTLSSTVATGALTITGAATYTTELKSTTALATPGALSATQATAFASTVSGAAIMGFGTTNDVALMNRAGTVVLGIGPNTTTVNMTGLLTVSGFGTSSFSAGGTGFNILSLKNTTSGTGNGSYIELNAGTQNAYIMAFSQGYTTSAPNYASGLKIVSEGAGGMDIVSSNVSGAIRFYSGGTTERMTLSSAGLLTVSGFGTHTFGAGGTGTNQIKVVNTNTGTGDAASLYALSGTTSLLLSAYNQSFTTSGTALQGGTRLYADGAGGLSVVADHASGAIRFYSGGTTLRGTILTTGQQVMGSSGTVRNSAWLTIDYSGSTYNALSLNDNSSSNGGTFQVFAVGAGTVCGSVSRNGATSAVVYNLTSDKRLKHDLGLATDLSGLRGLAIHDFTWITDESGYRDRGVFAQDAYQVMPRGITPGKTEQDYWQVSYTSYVPDLIVGWQQHDARLAVLEAKLLAAGV